MKTKPVYQFLKPLSNNEQVWLLLMKQFLQASADNPSTK